MDPQKPITPRNPINPGNKIICSRNEAPKSYKTPYAKEKVPETIQDIKGQSNI